MLQYMGPWGSIWGSIWGPGVAYEVVYGALGQYMGPWGSIWGPGAVCAPLPSLVVRKTLSLLCR
jgi:hypothetical protein